MLTSMLFAIVLLITLATCAPLADEILSLPGWTDALPSRHFSGFVSNNDGGFLHYYWAFPEEVDAATAPVVFWTNGGPGCSSMEGWGYELGPFKFFYWNTTQAAGVDGYSGSAPFQRNPYAWNRLAHVVFLENPPGVGFSYRTDGNFSTNDTRNALSSYNAIANILSGRFPEFLSNGFYIAGESYAGIYIPTIADVILNETSPLLVNHFKGVLIGNGVTDNTYDSNFAYSNGLYAMHHGVILQDSYLEIVAACIPDGASDACNELYNTFNVDGPHMNPYGFSNLCFNPSDIAGGLRRSGSGLRRKLRPRKLRRAPNNVALSRGAGIAGEWKASASASDTTPRNAPGENITLCGDEVFLDRYLGRDDVRAALHVPPDFVGLSRICYDVPYESDVWSVVPIYERLISRGVTIVVFNGDSDMIVPYTGTFQWIYRSTSWRILRDFRQWDFIDPIIPGYGLQVGGQATQLTAAGNTTDVTMSGGVWLVLINGAGHMVPEDRPTAAFEMFRRVVQGEFFAESPLLTSTKPFLAPNIVSPTELSNPSQESQRLVAAVVGGIVGGLILGALAGKFVMGGTLGKTTRMPLNELEERLN